MDGITFQARSEVYLELLRYIDSQVAIAVLGQTLTSQPGESGSYSLGQVHNEVRKDIEQSDAERLAEVLERDLVVPIVTLNNGPRKRYPRLVIERTESMNIKLLSDSLEKLVPMGLKVRADEVRTLLNMTAPDEGDDVLTAPSAAMMPPGDKPAAPNDEDEDDENDPAVARAKARVTALNDDTLSPLERALDAIDVEDWDALAEPLVKPVLDAARLAPESLMADLAGLYPSLDAAALEAQLERIVFVADAWGRLSGQDDV